MIKRLIINNYAIIESVTVEFSKSLTIITGETGAGKSILLGALSLIMGDRTETRVLFDPNKKCVVEAYFDVLYYDLKELFERLEIEYDTEIVIRREISPSGKSRAFVNDTPVRLNDLREVASRLIDLHRQFDTLALQNEAFQLQMLDAIANNKTTLQRYQEIYRTYEAEKRLLEKYIADNQRAQNEHGFLQFQLDELQKATLVEGEFEELEQELAQLTNAEDIKRITQGAFQLLSESEVAIISQMRDLAQQVNAIKAFHPELPSLHTRFEEVMYELRDIANEFENVCDATEFDERRINEVQERVELIFRLQKKHLVASVGELLAIQQDLEQRLSGMADLSAEIQRLQAAVAAKQLELDKIALVLRERRLAHTEGFEAKIQTMLAQLNMPHAQLKIDVAPADALTPTGKDKVTYWFAANKGSRPDLIRNVASGGELSRLTLCTKSLVASAIPLPTMIFDEIDAGVSGDVAGKMGDILRQLSDEHQVITITHTPQIASKGDVHYFVFKQLHGDRTKTSVKKLSRKERVHEIATMLSGNPPSEYAMRNAIDLLDKK